MNADDVAAVVELAREHHLPLSIYGGGHSVKGSAVVDAGICADLRGMKGITVDPDARIVRAEPGLTWGEFDAATQEHGLAVTGGRVSTTGIAGLALGSGSGWLERKLGFTCDNLMKAEVVTAGGDHVIASEDENADLFWGLRGGGGNFGIVTAFHFLLHPIGPILLGGIFIWPAAMARDLVRFWRDFMRDAPDEVNVTPVFITAPPEEFVPAPARGQPVVAAMASYNGPVEDGEEALRPIREFGPPAVDLVQPMPYVALQQLLDPTTPKGLQNYWTADFLAELPDDAIDVWVSHATKPVSPLTQIVLAPGGGAIARVDEEATAFDARNAPFNVHYLSMWADPADTEKNIAYTRAIATAMKPWTTGRGLRELHWRRGPRSDRGRVRTREVRPSPGAQGEVGPREPVPAQPEHPTRRVLESLFLAGPIRSSRLGVGDKGGDTHALRMDGKKTSLSDLRLS